MNQPPVPPSPVPPPPTGRPLARQRDHRPPVARPRAWLFGGLTSALVLVLSTVFGWWVETRNGVHADVAAPGAVVVDRGVSYQVVKVEQRDSMPAAYGEPHRAPAEMVYLVWTIKVKRPPASESTCILNLVGRDQQVWFTARGIAASAPVNCLPMVMPTGEGEMQQVYLVARHKLPELLGVQPDHPMGLQQPPILPAP